MSKDWSTPRDVSYISLREAQVELIDCDHRTPPASNAGYPYVAIPQLHEGRIQLSEARRIKPEHYLEWTKKAKPQAFDVVLSRRCNPGETAVVEPGMEFALGQNLVLLRADGTKVYPPYLRWLVRSPDWWEQVSKFINVGAVFDSLKCADIPNFHLPIPALSEQCGIDHILGSLDDKIELNRRMNETLEAMARAIFKSWFIDFDPVHRNIARRTGRNQPSPGLQPPSPNRRGVGGEGAQLRKANFRGGYDFAGLVETARELRRRQTPAEEILWELVRDRRFMGLKFRRQHQIGDYVADFYCHQHRLVVELDGPMHGEEMNVKKDAKRDAYLRSLGFTVLRFPNQQLMETPESVLRAIARTANPLPLGEGPGEGSVEGIEARLPSPRGRRVGVEGVIEGTAFDHLFPDSFQDSPLGKIPKDWKVGPIGDFVTAVGGSTPSTKEPNFWNGSIHFATPKDMSSLQFPVLLQTERRITEEGLQQISSGLLPRGTVLLSSRAPIGYLAVTEIPTAVNQGMIAIICDKQLPNLYLLYWVKENLETIIANANGTTFLEISKANFRPITAIAPSPSELERFTEAVGPLNRLMVNNEEQSRNLAAIRDALLPKLISGEVRVQPCKGR